MNKLETFKNVGWIENTGTMPDLENSTLIRVRYKNGIEDTVLFSHEFAKPEAWQFEEALTDITHYQILELGKTVEGDPIVVGAEYVDRGEQPWFCLGNEQHNNEMICFSTLRGDTRLKRVYSNGMYYGSCTISIGDIMRLHRPKKEEAKQPRTITVDGVKYREVVQ